MSNNPVVVCTWGEERGGLPGGAEEVLTLANQLSQSLGADLNWLTLGASASGHRRDRSRVWCGAGAADRRRET